MTVLERCQHLRERITQRDHLRRADKEAEAFRAQSANCDQREPNWQMM